MRFYRGGAMYHNDKSFAMCIDNVPELPRECWLNKDWKCLTETARKVHKALE